MQIYTENDELLKRINAKVKFHGLDRKAFIERLAEGLIPASANRETYKQDFLQNRCFLLDKFLVSPVQTFSYPTDLNDVLRCVYKATFGSKAYGKLLKDKVIGAENLCSISDMACYDPQKNGQNILKHGIPFHATYSYCCGHIPLITVNRGGRRTMFSRYYYQGNNHSFMYAEKPDRDFDFVASVFDIRQEGGFRFISSRVINLDDDINHQLELLISAKIPATELANLRARALNILQKSTNIAI